MLHASVLIEVITRRVQDLIALTESPELRSLPVEC